MQVPLYQAKAEFFRMLGHPVRIRVLELLQSGPMPVRDLLAEIDIEASNLSQQLGVLRRAGIVVSLRDGSTVSYALAGGDVADLLRAARRILTELLAGQSELLAELRQAGPESDRRADTDTDGDTDTRAGAGARAGSGGRAVERAEACGEP
ncbi:metalloregulator ArsR/SmtB family transcription factor [Streptomyces subrutilus]|uniref:ArsR/SmtB family transcription factor n=1 Tax=Streptomyces subrutilus TaxID=36818 RepID=UPI0033CA6CF4